MSPFHELLEEIDEQLTGRVPMAGFPVLEELIRVAIRTTGGIIS